MIIKYRSKEPKRRKIGELGEKEEQIKYITNSYKNQLLIVQFQTSERLIETKRTKNLLLMLPNKSDFLNFEVLKAFFQVKGKISKI